MPRQWLFEADFGPDVGERLCRIPTEERLRQASTLPGSEDSTLPTGLPQPSATPASPAAAAGSLPTVSLNALRRGPPGRAMPLGRGDFVLGGEAVCFVENRMGVERVNKAVYPGG
jgi:hypothetical protein